ncbi:hypothetical protein HMI55_006862 [Coelomomyces lativittatus]|nr:hypothetical protein HMI55_006862 [Coelomomyces lativittatus]
MTNVEDANYKVGSTLHLLQTQHPALPSLQEAESLVKLHIQLPVKKILTSHTHYPGYLISHVVRHLNLPSHWTSVKEGTVSLFEALQTLHTLATTCPSTSQGYLYMDLEHPEVYVDVQPFFLDMGLSYRTVPDFDQAADIYFSALESQKIQQKQTQHVQQASKKLISMSQEHQAREEMLLKDQELTLTQASLIETHATLVDALILMIQQAIASGMDWTEIERHIESEKKKVHGPLSNSNPFHFIHHLELKRNIMVLEFEKVQIPILLNMSAMANARRLYGHKKKTQSKHVKTVVAHAKALTVAQIKWNQAKPTIVPSGFLKLRKPMWFEKFHWCLSSDAFLMIAGKDMHQNERLVKKYLLPGDVYVHAELHGAPSVIVKKPTDGSVIPPSTLTQAGCMALCLSKAWESKIVVEVWWVHADQVSKSAPSGEYLSTGSFMIRGRKNVLPPSTLVYGLGILFKLDEESTQHRRLLRQKNILMEKDIDQSQGTTEKNANEVESEIEVPEEVGEEVEVDEETDEKFNVTLPPITMEEGLEALETLSQIIPLPSKEPSISEPSLIAELEQMVLMEEDALDTIEQPNIDKKARLNEYALKNELQEKDDSVLRQKVGTKHLSAAVRRRLKKTGGNVTDFSPSKPNQSSTPTTPLEECSIRTPRVRGKHGKLKKIKEKYADQDDEERDLAMSLLKSNQGPQPKGKKQKQKHAKQLEMEKAQQVWLEQQQQQQLKNDFKSVPSTSIEGDSNLDSFEKEALISSRSLSVKESTKPNSLSDGTKQINHERVEEGNSEGEEVVVDEVDVDEGIVGVEDDDEDEEEEAAKLTLSSWLEADSLTWSPTSEETILYALPVCAPYTSLQMYPLKVKLLPGTLKKGKAYKSSLNVFLNQTQDPLWQRLVKDIREPDWINVIKGGVKILAPQLTQIQQKQRKQKKQTQKQFQIQKEEIQQQLENL